ncbi:MAG TPA: hypothetical protein PLT71_11090, partial [Bacteroidales bacterium]|nr:hypothetical protein [Bacteroidales bacterium]
MISRRQLRIKALTVLYSCNRKEISDLETAEQELMLSIRRSYDLYHYLLLLLISLSDLAREKVALSGMKKIPGPEDINPNRRFADNRVIDQLRKNRQLRSYSEATPALWTSKDKLNSMKALNRWIATKGLSWNDYPEVVRIIFNEMIQWEVYKAYMSSLENSYKADLRFIKELVTKFFPASQDLETSLEEQSVYWNDDLPFAASMIRNSL